MKANEVSFFCTRVMDRLIVVTDGGKGVFGDIQQAQTHPPRSSLSLYKHDGHESTPETYIETCSSIGLPPLHCQGQLRFHESFDRTDRTTSYEAIVAQEICFGFSFRVGRDCSEHIFVQSYRNLDSPSAARLKKIPSMEHGKCVVRSLVLLYINIYI